jgi:hypothetical protein
MASKLSEFRRAYERNRHGFEALLPDPIWDRARPANFVWNGLVRRLVSTSGAIGEATNETDAPHAATKTAMQLLVDIRTL